MAIGDWPANKDGSYPVPTDAGELARFLSDPMARICSGLLYKIMVKNEADDADEGKVEPFKPNLSQRRFMARMWHRNLILKARQLGFTTLICILWLDHAMFVPDQRCVLIAQDLPKATEIFRDKIKFAYDRMPASVRAANPPLKWTETEVLLANNSAVKVTNSARSGTVDRLHISEMGKIGAKTPQKANEIVKGSFPAVPDSGIIVVESTAEGQDGQFYKLTMKAQEHAEKGKVLTRKDFRFHFFAWWQEPGYTMPVASVPETAEDREYFARTEAAIGRRLTQEQRNWYVSTRESDFSGEDESMWQEYPSTPEEAFMVSTEGTYYAKQLAAARKSKRIGFFPHKPGVPVHTFWDIGASDGTGVWLMQQIGAENRFIGYIEGWGEGYDHYTTQLQKLEYQWGRHHLPHDADHKRQTGPKLESAQDALEATKLGGEWIIVPRIDDITHGINLTRRAFATATFDEAGCAKGIKHLGLYRKEWDEKLGTWKLHPRHDIHSECADAFRQYGQGFEAASVIKPTKAKPRNWRSA